MNKLKTLLRYPQLLIDLAGTGVVLLVAFGVGLSGDQQTYIVAAVVALLGLAKGVFVKPFAVPMLTDFARAVLVLGASFGVGLTADQIALLVTFLGMVTTLVATLLTTPAYDQRALSPVVVQGQVVDAAGVAKTVPADVTALPPA